MKLISTVSADNFIKCSVCIEATYAKKPFQSITSRQTTLLELVHSDLADLKNTASKGAKRYYITFVDDFSRYTEVHLLRSKNEAEEIFLKYKVEVENQLERKIKRFRTGRSEEYETTSLIAFCEKNGIIHEVNVPRTP